MADKLHFADEGRKLTLFGKTYRWVLKDGGYKLKKVEVEKA